MSCEHASPSLTPTQTPVWDAICLNATALFGVVLQCSEWFLSAGIVSLGLKYADGIITGGNARCVAMLSAFKQVPHHLRV